MREAIEEAIAQYEGSLDQVGMMEAAEALMDAIMGRFHADGIDSVWYARSVDRVNKSATYGSQRHADDCTFYGLVRLIEEWADNANPKAVRMENE